MSVATIFSAHIVGLQAEPVSVEIDVSSGMYSFSIIGLPDKSIDESKDRIISAIKNSNLKNPKSEGHKVVVSLAPADIKKEGSHFDLPITIAYLLASKQIKGDFSQKWFVGELSLTGEIQSMQGILSITECAKNLGIKEIYVPEKNKEEAALVSGINVYGCKNLKEIVKHFGGLIEENDIDVFQIKREEETELIYSRPDFFLDFKDILGQTTAKRALEIAASGGHNIALFGPPGTGKTMLARAFTGILPPLSKDEVFEVTRIHSIASNSTKLITHPPFRSPHHTSSYVSLVGGGTNPKPGEVTLSHRGVLFLDEFPEFEKRAIESLRQPLEEGVISVSRAKGTFLFPASCILVAAMNPCPCGYLGSKAKRCTCKQSDVERYKRKLSGPIVDRIDLWVPVLHIDYETLSHLHSDDEDSDKVRERVIKTRSFAENLFKEEGDKISMNKYMSSKDIKKHIKLTEKAKEVIKVMSEKHSLSPRSYHRILRVAKTIANMEHKESIEDSHILEAFQYRPKGFEE